MKQTIFLLTCIFLFQNAFTQKGKTESICSFDNPVSSLGIGLVIPGSIIELYNDSLLRDKYLSWNIDSESQPIKPICSKYFKPDYHIIHFVCVGIAPQYFKVLINFNQIKYIPKISSCTFKTWSDYILQSYGIRRLVTSKNGENFPIDSIRKEPRLSSSLGPIPHAIDSTQVMFCHMRVEGEWVQVIVDCFEMQDENFHSGEPCHSYINECSTPVNGWIKWREKNEILIEIFLMP